MDAALEQYFELALDLPERKRNALLQRLDASEPEMARSLRRMLGDLVHNDDFLCRAQQAETEAPTATDSARGPAQTRALDDLHHIAIQVTDVAKACEWYRSVFQCQVEYQDATWAQIKFGNVRLALVVPDQHPPHIAILREDAERFGPLQRHRDGSRSAYIVDPFSNSVEILEKGSLPADPA